MVKALDSVSSFFNGVWVHVNFLAKLKGATQCPDLVPKFFFAEVKRGPDGLSCVSCVKIDPSMLNHNPRYCHFRSFLLFYPSSDTVASNLNPPQKKQMAKIMCSSYLVVPSVTAFDPNPFRKSSFNSGLFLAGSPEATPIRGCGICLNNAIYYPAAGGHRGDRKSVCQMHTLWRSL